MTVSGMLEQPCNKSDNAIERVTSCYQLVPNLLQQTRCAPEPILKDPTGTGTGWN